MANIMKEINQAVDAHAFNDFEYFGGVRPVFDMATIVRDMRVRQFADGTESWADFLSVNVIHLEGN